MQAPLEAQSMAHQFERPQYEPTERFPRDWGGTYASGGHDACEHERVFNGYRFVCHNPAWFWVCSRCGRTDVCQFVDADVKPQVDLPRFARLMLELRGTGIGATGWRGGHKSKIP